MQMQIAAPHVARLFSEGVEAEPPKTRAAQMRQRAKRFKETLGQRLTRNILGLAYALRPKRLADAPALLSFVARARLVGQAGLPDPEAALSRPDGLCGLAYDLSPGAMLDAYARGIFAWKHCGPLKLWAPAQRYCVTPTKLKVNKNVARLLRRGDFTVSFDRAFDSVVLACASRRPKRPPLTWLTPEMMIAFANLHDEGHAHSFEVWDKSGALVGGGFGVAVGRVFVTESQFSRVSNASKVGFTELNRCLAGWGFVLNDCKYYTPALEEMGFADMPRAEYNELLRDNLGFGKTGRWRFVAPPVAVPEKLKRAA
jgi:leucyl/phenylalanyl-tRNA---protein transferase